MFMQTNSHSHPDKSEVTYPLRIEQEEKYGTNQLLFGSWK